MTSWTQMDTFWQFLTFWSIFLVFLSFYGCKWVFMDAIEVHVCQCTSLHGCISFLRDFWKFWQHFGTKMAILWKPNIQCSWNLFKACMKVSMTPVYGQFHCRSLYFSVFVDTIDSQQKSVLQFQFWVDIPTPQSLLNLALVSKCQNSQ